ncbi:hypothetical protein H2198_009374 [Neophaeococcomyces mojaviensis]|uniref:Uncharacterized protein n=1 Tax=Neophaeococcomyces mojaviensis TaxID=3383035 RepID=A0ACC2ZUM7_9EURO|nr:hypothetical protein H2198_009374 [Knufia sp. JES_112]
MAADTASEKEQTVYQTKKHRRTSSYDQWKLNQQTTTTIIESVEQDDDVPAIASPSRTKSRMSDRPKTKRRKSSTSTPSHKSRPAYSRKYSTPPSRPLSPSGYPQLLESDGVIPEIDLNQTTSQLHHFHQQQQQHQHHPHHPHQHQQQHQPQPQPQPQYQQHQQHQQQQAPIQHIPQYPPQHYFDLSVDTAPQEPDIWDDPETDYFSTIEIEAPPNKHGRVKSRRQVSQNLNSMLHQSMAAKGLQQISEDAEFLLPPTPGAFAA